MWADKETWAKSFVTVATISFAIFFTWISFDYYRSLISFIFQEKHKLVLVILYPPSYFISLIGLVVGALGIIFLIDPIAESIIDSHLPWTDRGIAVLYILPLSILTCIEIFVLLTFA